MATLTPAPLTWSWCGQDWCEVCANTLVYGLLRLWGWR